MANEIKRFDPTPYLVVLGIAQDAGFPQTKCYKEHCLNAWQNRAIRKMATSLGIVSPAEHQTFLFEATPDLPQQLYDLHRLAPDSQFDLAGIFLTHGHMGHYTGLMHLGRESANTHQIPVFAMPRMEKFLRQNGPWSQLIKLKNITIQPLKHNALNKLSSQLSIKPFIVPHRDEFTETVGFEIIGPSKKVLFIPDIDKWNKWSEDILEKIRHVDYAFLDATFFNQDELPGRNMAEIPHPSVSESMKHFAALSANDRKKVFFIHFNHSNPLLNEKSEAVKIVTNAGYNVAKEGLQIKL